MRTTLSRQIQVLGKLYNRVRSLGTERCLITRVRLSQKEKAALNDAASTLAAVNMIGVKRIEMLPELMEAAKGVCREFDSEVDSINAFKKLELALKKMA